jgi:SAM-dependent methyltransferase
LISLLASLKSILWINRRSETDVVNLYNSITPFVRIALAEVNKNTMLNFGYWDKSTTSPIAAQIELCRVVGEFADLQSATKIIDLGSGFCAPAAIWKYIYENKILDIVCVDINLKQLITAMEKITTYSTKLLNRSDLFNNYIVNANIEVSKRTRSKNSILPLVNATATRLPFADNCVDRIIALESAQHFKPLSKFLRESKRVLTSEGLLVVAVPVLGPSFHNQSLIQQLAKLKILYFTWASEHYSLERIKSEIIAEGFQIRDIKHIGHHVYEPCADYYIQNRWVLRQRLKTNAFSYARSLLIGLVEKIVYISALKMKDSSQKEIIDYVLIRAAPASS